jgi:hypothetical protein
MKERDWKQEIRDHIENVRIIERCRAETLGHFEQFCEFIAEPAAEDLAGELAEHGIRAGHRKVKDREFAFTVCFPGTKDEQFRYRLVLPPNSVELKLDLVVETRRTRRADFVSKTESFMPGLKTEEILKLDKSEIILDLLDRYKSFIYETMTTPD